MATQTIPTETASLASLAAGLYGLDMPGTSWVRYLSARYLLREGRCPFGFLVVRLSDGASIWQGGDDAELLDSEVARIERTCGGREKELARRMDDLLSEYDDVLTT